MSSASGQAGSEDGVSNDEPLLRLVAELHDEVRALRAEGEVLRTRVAELETAGGRRPASAAGGAAASESAAIDPTLARRQFLTRASAIAAGVAAAATVGGVARPDVAAAADGDNLRIGGVNGGTTRTVLVTTGPLEYGFGVHEAGLASFLNQAAVAGHAKDNYDTAVLGFSEGQTTGVLGRTTEGIGVRAASFGAGTALNASSDDGTAVFAVNGAVYDGVNTPAVSVVADQGAIGVSVVADRGLLLQTRNVSTAPPLRNAPFLAGQLAVSDNGAANDVTLWLCTKSGTPGTWRKLGGPETAGSLHVLPSTARVYDSRAGTNPTTVTKGKFGHTEERVIDAKLGGQVPAGATAVLMNITATNTNPGGFFAMFSNAVAWPGNSSLNWGLPNSTVANTTVVAVDALARFKAHLEGPGGADLIVDVIGYYR